MSRRRAALTRSVWLSMLFMAVLAVSSCGIPIHTIAEPADRVINTETRFGATLSTRSVFAPCSREKGSPHAISAVADLLYGKDAFAVDCAPVAPTVTPWPGDPTAGQAPPPPPAANDLMTDDLMRTVLTGTGEFLYQHAVGPT